VCILATFLSCIICGPSGSTTFVTFSQEKQGFWKTLMDTENVLRFCLPLLAGTSHSKNSSAILFTTFGWNISHSKINSAILSTTFGWKISHSKNNSAILSTTFGWNISHSKNNSAILSTTFGWNISHSKNNSARLSKK
jgi:hypothetical protein